MSDFNDNIKNRADDISKRNVESKDVTIGLIDIDIAIIEHLEKNIRLSVNTNDIQIPVPIIYGSPERWKGAQKDGYYRDKNGALMCPLVMVRRTNMEKKRTISRNLDANHPMIYISHNRNYSQRNQYDRFSVLNNTLPQYEINRVIVPDYMQITYECIMWADYAEQLNKLQEALIYAESSYWGEPDKFMFYSTVSSFSNVIEVTDNTERMVKSSFDITVHGYIIPELLQKELSKFSNVAYTVKRIETDNTAK